MQTKSKRSIAASVVRAEGLASAFRRARERVAEALRWPRGLPRSEILNYCAMSTAPRAGGVAVQLQARLRVERHMRPVALLDPRMGIGIRDALALTGATLLHIEGTFGVDAGEIAALGVPYIVSVHDLSATRELLAGASAVVYASRYTRDAYGIDGAMIEPGVEPVRVRGGGDGVAFAGSLHEHKGARLLPEIARALDGKLHVFGGGDARFLRGIPNVVLHGYYRAGSLPSLLARHRIGTVVLPSLVPEAYSLVLSESWLAGAAVVAFDHGAVAERIRRDGGGWLAPLTSGAAGLIELLARRMWIAIPRNIPTPADAARAYAALYAQSR